MQTFYVFLCILYVSLSAKSNQKRIAVRKITYFYVLLSTSLDACNIVWHYKQLFNGFNKRKIYFIHSSNLVILCLNNTIVDQTSQVYGGVAW